jgi:hypothetical protein
MEENDAKGQANLLSKVLAHLGFFIILYGSADPIIILSAEEKKYRYKT